jgi:hypothetical protein
MRSLTCAFNFILSSFGHAAAAEERGGIADDGRDNRNNKANRRPNNLTSTWILVRSALEADREDRDERDGHFRPSCFSFS